MNRDRLAQVNSNFIDALEEGASIATRERNFVVADAVRNAVRNLKGLVPESGELNLETLPDALQTLPASKALAYYLGECAKAMSGEQRRNLLNVLLHGAVRPMVILSRKQGTPGPAVLFAIETLLDREDIADDEITILFHDCCAYEETVSSVVGNKGRNRTTQVAEVAAVLARRRPGIASRVLEAMGVLSNLSEPARSFLDELSMKAVEGPQRTPLRAVSPGGL